MQQSTQVHLINNTKDHLTNNTKEPLIKIIQKDTQVNMKALQLMDCIQMVMVNLVD